MRCALLLRDERWIDPDLDLANGIELHEQGDMLRIDSLIMNMQINLRQLLSEQGLPDINMIGEKVSLNVEFQ